jgi:alkyl hydroperoxide reductase subunit AhpC
LPVLNALGERYAQQGVVILAINVEKSAAGYAKWAESNAHAYVTLARDTLGEIGKLYHVRAVPATYVLDQEGVIQHAHVGWGRGMEKTLAREIEALLD